MVFSEDGFTFSHAVLVRDEISIMIDTGVGGAIKEIPPDSIDIVINSHCHLDHINGNDYFSKAKKIAHPIEIQSMKDPEMTTATKGWDDLMDGDRENIAKAIALFNPRYIEPWEIDEELDINSVIDCGKTKINVLHTPGHTQGHCSFHFPGLDFVFTADICLSKVGPWYGDPSVKICDFINSAKKIISLKPKIVTTGHVLGILNQNIDKMFEEYLSRIYRREEKILAFLKESPQTINDLCEKKPVYEDHPSPFVIFWEKSMIKKHLEKLINEGQVKKEEKTYFIL